MREQRADSAKIELMRSENETKMKNKRKAALWILFFQSLCIFCLLVLQIVSIESFDVLSIIIVLSTVHKCLVIITVIVCRNSRPNFLWIPYTLLFG